MANDEALEMRDTDLALGDEASVDSGLRSTRGNESNRRENGTIYVSFFL